MQLFPGNCFTTQNNMAWGSATITNEPVRCNTCVILRETNHIHKHTLRTKHRL